MVSPLTTLLANGMSPTEVIQMMTSAGLPGLTEETLYSDPMANLANKTGSVTAAELIPLQANMAVNTFMVANQNFDFNSPTAVTGAPVNFNDIVAVVQDSLNPVLFQQMIATHGASFTVGEMANAAANQIPQQITGGGTTTPPTTDTSAAQAIFTANCAGCHTVGTGAGINLAGDGAKVTGKFGNGSTHNGNSLTADEITAMAAYFDSQSGTTTPPTTGTGGGTTTPPATGTPDAQAIFSSNCAGCHTLEQGPASWILPVMAPR